MALILHYESHNNIPKIAKEATNFMQKSLQDYYINHVVRKIKEKFLWNFYDKSKQDELRGQHKHLNNEQWMQYMYTRGYSEK